MQNKESKVIKCHINLYKRIFRYIALFKEKYDVKISTVEATKKIDSKLESIGGISID